MSQDAPQDSEDAAWVTIETSYSTADLRAFLDDVERLYRINNLLVFEEWSRIGENRYRLRAENLSNGKQFESDLEVESGADGITVRYAEGLRTATSFRVVPGTGDCANLIVTDDYAGTSLAEREERIGEVDKSLIPWGIDIHRYLRRWKRWSWLPGWKLYMRRLWQPMKPMARRIAFMLWIVTAAEFVVFLLIFAIFWLELYQFLE
jgi:hypothetical protein